jgi:SPP1 gp7 family putative phage head morphogenesis protein
MPIPTPHADEDEQEFVSRCMGDAVMRRDYTRQDQRAAVCHSAWDRKGKAARVTKDEADYVSHPVAGDRCGKCTMFLAPDGCTLVRGSISIDGWCKYFESVMSKGWRKAPDDDHSLHAIHSRAAALLTAVDLGDWMALVEELAPELAAVWADGVENALPLVGFTSDETLNEARAAFGLDAVAGGDVAPSIVNQVNERSVEWARQRAANLVTQIEENTREMLRATVVQAIEEGWGADKLGDQIAESAAFSDARAEMIGRTEVIAANNEGALAAYKASGVATGKEWLTAQDDLVSEECEMNEADGPIGLDELFSSGDEAPPLHPNCRCSLIPAFLDEDEL